jgi:hypothetical protein
VLRVPYGDEHDRLLLLRVWWHDGVPLARILGRSVREFSLADLGVAAGEEAILAAVTRWLRDGPDPTAND